MPVFLSTDRTDDTSEKEAGEDSLSEPSDEILLHAHQQGDIRAFEELVRRYGDGLIGYLRSMCRDEGQVEDLFQETFRRVHEKAASFRGTSGTNCFKSWLFKIASNLVIDGWRRKSKELTVSSLSQKNQRHENEDCPQVAEPAASASFNPYNQTKQAEQIEHVRQAVDELPPQQKAILTLTYYQGLSYREAAQVLGCSLGMVKRQMYRAVKKLAQTLPQDMAEV